MNLARLLARHAEAGLTETERDTLARKLGGYTNLEIARIDGVSERAVRYRLQSANAKLAALWLALDQAAGQEPPDA